MISRTRFLSLLTLCIPALIPSGVLRGQSISSPYRFVETKQEAGIYFGQRSPGTGRFGYGPGPGLIMGARYAIRLGGPFAIEGNVGFLSSERDLVDPTRVEGDRVVGTAESGLMTLDARLRFSLTGERTWHNLTPFVLVGGGGAWGTRGAAVDEDTLLLPEDRFDFGSSFTGLFGGGLQWYFSERFLARGDFTLMMWQLKAPQGFRDPERALVGVDEKEWVSGPSFSFGISYRF
jgi:hypothetical protein